MLELKDSTLIPELGELVSILRLGFLVLSPLLTLMLKTGDLIGRVKEAISSGMVLGC